MRVLRHEICSWSIDSAGRIYYSSKFETGEFQAHSGGEWFVTTDSHLEPKVSQITPESMVSPLLFRCWTSSPIILHQMEQSDDAVRYERGWSSILGVK
jgi:hypothetical protein